MAKTALVKICWRFENHKTCPPPKLDFIGKKGVICTAETVHGKFVFDYK